MIIYVVHVNLFLVLSSKFNGEKKFNFLKRHKKNKIQVLQLKKKIILLNS